MGWMMWKDSSMMKNTIASDVAGNPLMLDREGCIHKIFNVSRQNLLVRPIARNNDNDSAPTILLISTSTAATITRSRAVVCHTLT